MKEFLLYILQSTVLLTGLYLAYKALLARDSFHTIKRMVLMIGVACSLLIPALPITIYVASTPEAAPNAEVTQTAVALEIAEPTNVAVKTTLPSGIVAQPAATFDWTLLILWIYVAGVVLLTIYRTIGVIGVLRILRKSTPLMTYRGVRVFATDTNIPPFCFGRKIVISSDEPAENLAPILTHELSHINHRHEIDLLIINTLLSIMWFNPAVWLLRKELILLQEYQADKQVIKNGIDAKKYQYLLICRVLPELNLQPVVNHFAKNHLSKRITMMKKQSKSIGKLKLLALIPVLTIAVLACAQTQQRPTTTTQSDEFHIPYSGTTVGKFGEQINPITRKNTFHNGIDIVTDNDTVRSPFSGEVTFCEFDKSGYGNKLVIEHSGGIETTYAHLAKFLVSNGSTVKSGEPIAIVGNTGRSAGKHLHLECRVNGEIVDPATVFPKNTTDQNYTLSQLKALLNSRPNAMIATYASNGSIFSETVSPMTPMAAEDIDFSKIYSWEVIGGEKLKQIYPDSNVDYLIKFLVKTDGDKPELDLDNVNMVFKVYDHNGKLIKEAFGTQAKILESIPAADIASVSYNASNVTSKIVLDKPKVK